MPVHRIKQGTPAKACSQPPVLSLKPLTMADCPATSSKALRMSYRIARGEQGVLTFEPYKSHLLPKWRFKTPSIAEQSSRALWSEFLRYDTADDFVGMDMARKFIQMGMTRAKRYANYAGGRKYGKVAKGQGGGENGTRGKQKELSKGHKDKESKEESSLIFREVWERCKAHEGYSEKKERFLAEQTAWDKEQRERKQRGEDSDGDHSDEAAEDES